MIDESIDLWVCSDYDSWWESTVCYLYMVYDLCAAILFITEDLWMWPVRMVKHIFLMLRPVLMFMGVFVLTVIVLPLIFHFHLRKDVHRPEANHPPDPPVEVADTITPSSSASSLPSQDHADEGGAKEEKEEEEEASDSQLVHQVAMENVEAIKEHIQGWPSDLQDALPAVLPNGWKEVEDQLAEAIRMNNDGGVEEVRARIENSLRDRTLDEIKNNMNNKDDGGKNEE